MAYFQGEYNYALDQKGRVKIPAPFKKDLAPGEEAVVYLTRDVENCVAVYTPDEYALLRERLQGLNMQVRANRQLVRRLVSSVFECPVDNQGRIKVPAALVAHARLEKGGTVTLAGFQRIVQIWNPPDYLQAIEEGGDILSEQQSDVEL